MSTTSSNPAKRRAMELYISHPRPCSHYEYDLQEVSLNISEESAFGIVHNMVQIQLDPLYQRSGDELSKSPHSITLPFTVHLF